MRRYIGEFCSPAFGSLRRSEVCALTVADVGKNNVTVNKAVVRNEKYELVTKSPKTETGYRTITLAPSIIGELKIAKLPQEDKVVDLTPGQVTQRFSKMLKTIGLPHFCFHGLRHYQASILHALDVPENYIMERGGWKSEQTLKQLYTHTLKAKSEEFGQIANAHFSELLKTKNQG